MTGGHMRLSRAIGRSRLPISLGCAGIVVAAMVVAGLALTPPPVRPRLLPGDIWLASRAVGQLTLVDGVSAQVSAAVGVTGPDAHFVTAQSDRDGYAVNSASNQVVGVNDATLEKTATTLSESGQTAIYPATEALFAVNHQAQDVQLVEPDTFARIGKAMTLFGQNPVLASDGQTLWVADGPTGTLTSYRDDNGTPRRNIETGLFDAGTAQPRLTIANGLPVLVDPTGRTVSLLSSSGRVSRAMRLPLRPADLVSGSSDTDSIDIVQPDHGLLTVCDLDHRACSPSYPLTGLDHDLGPAVQSGGHVFVPDYSSDVVRIVDLADRGTRQTEPLFGGQPRFELLTRDHIVYVNDPDSEKAAVVAPDGRIRRIDKYDPQHPFAAVVTPGPDPSRSGPPTPSTLPIPTGSGHPIPAGVTGPAAAGGSAPASKAPNAPGPHILAIATDPATPEATLPVTFSAQVTGAPTGWAWTITTRGGRPEAAGTTPRLVHTFAVVGVYQVRLVVTAGSLHDTQSIQLTVIPFTPPLRCGETVTTSSVLTSDLNCTGTALTVGAPDITLDLGGHTVTGSPGVLVNVAANVTVTDGAVHGGVTFENSPFGTLSRATVDTFAPNDSPNTKVEHATLTTLDGRAAIGAQSIIDTTMRGGGMKFLGGAVFISGCTFINSDVSFNDAGSGSPGFAITNNTFMSSGLALIQSDASTISGNTFSNSRVALIRSGFTVVQQNNFTQTNGVLVISDVDSQNDIIDGNTFDGGQVGVGIDLLELTFIDGSRITDNTFTNEGMAGVNLSATMPSVTRMVTISGNTFVSNGFRSAGATDPDGHPINDGLHVDVPAASSLIIANNTTRDDAEYGIEAQPGTVQDGGGNTSRRDPKGCLGVHCG